MSQQGIPPFSPPVPTQRPGGRWWWIGTAVLHAACAVFFAVGVWGCVHWLQRVNTDAYVEAHRDAADLMPVFELVMLGLAALCALAVAYCAVGLCLALSRNKAGPAMLMISAVPVFFVGSVAAAEVGLDGVPATVFGLALLATVPASMVVGGIVCVRPQRPSHRQQAVAPIPPPYTGGSPYLR